MKRKKLSVLDFLDGRPLDRSLLIGFYGGGNYGDELLLEILQNLLSERRARNITIPYKDPGNFATYHHDFGYHVVDWSITSLLRGMARNKNIVVGGGGLWGLDASFKILVFGCLLFAARRIFGKRVYLLGIGYYGSAPRLGRISAWLAGKAANTIIARDTETYDNFSRIQPQTYLDKDMAWYIPQIDLRPYRKELQVLTRNIAIKPGTICVILRRFAAKHANDFDNQIERFISRNQDKQILVTLMEPRTTFPEGHQLIAKWQKQYPHIQTIESEQNPLVLFLIFQKHRKNLKLIAPQFHAIITAHLNNVPFLPIVYDNKVDALLDQIDQTERTPIDKVTFDHIQAFADAATEEV